MRPYSVLVIAAVFALSGCTKKEAGDATATDKTPTANAKADAEAPASAHATGPVATVNGKPIPAAEFNEMFDKMTRVYTKRKQTIPDNVARRHKKNIVKRLIEKALLRQEITKQAIVVSEAELNDGIAKYKELFRSDANFQRYLKNSKTTLDKIKENIRYNKSLDKLLEQDKPIEISEADAKTYYESNKRRYQEQEQVKASHILLKINEKDGPNAEKVARKKAQDIVKEARAKDAKFSELAKKYSQGPTALKGGNLGYFTRGRMAKPFEEAAFKLKPGSVSDPVKTKFGWHIIKTFEYRAAREKPLAEAKESIMKLLDSRERRLRKSRLLRDIKAQAKIETLIELPEPEPRKVPKIGTSNVGLPGSSVKLHLPGAGGKIPGLKPVPPSPKTSAPKTP